MNNELRNRIIKENKFYDLLNCNPQYKLQGYSMKAKKVVVGIIQGDPGNYKQEVDHLNFRYFDTWEDAYMQLSK